MTENRRITYLDTKAVVVFSFDFILRRHNLNWVGPKPNLPVQLSPCFYQILEKMLELYDDNFKEVTHGVDQEMLEAPEVAVENVGNGILRKCHLPVQPRNQTPPMISKTRSNNHLILTSDSGTSNELVTPPNFMQSNVVILVYFAACLEVQKQIKLMKKTSLSRIFENGHHNRSSVSSHASINSNEVFPTDNEPFHNGMHNENGNDFESSKRSTSNYSLGNTNSHNVATSLNNHRDRRSTIGTDSVSCYEMTSRIHGMSVSSCSTSELSGGLDRSNTIFVANKVSSFINRNMGYFIDHYGGWEAWVRISASGGNSTSMSNPQSPNLSEREQDPTEDNVFASSLNHPPMLLSRSSRSHESNSTVSSNDRSRGGSSWILHDARLTTSLEDNPSANGGYSSGTDDTTQTLTSYNNEKTSYKNSLNGVNGIRTSASRMSNGSARTSNADSECINGSASSENKWNHFTNVMAAGVLGAGALLGTLLYRAK